MPPSPILPARSLGAGVFVEARPIEVGLSQVYRGADRGEVPVIVRELWAEVRTPELMAVFERVAQARQQMSGSATPALLRTLGRDGRVTVTVEEYVAGTSLHDLIHRGAGWMAPEIALAIGRALVSMWTLAEDAVPPVRFYVAPPAIRIDPEGRVRVVPELVEESERQEGVAANMLTNTSLSYISPEQITRSKTLPESAVFTLGLLLFEMLAGAHPFASESQSVFEVLAGITQHDAPPVSQRRPGLPPGVVDLVRRCLARAPGDRFPSFRDLSRALGAAQALFPPTGPAHIARYLTGLPHPLHTAVPSIAPPGTWPTLVTTIYEPTPLPPLPQAKPRRRR